MSFTWTSKLAARASDYRPDCLPAPVRHDLAVMNRTYALKRWVRGHVVQIDLAICAGLVIAGVAVFG